MENSWIATTIRHGVVSCEEKINQLLFKCLLATDLLATDLWQRIYGNGFMATDLWQRILLLFYVIPYRIDLLVSAWSKIS